MAQVVSAREAVQKIKDGDVCGFTTQSIAGYCQEIGDALVESYTENKTPKGITVVHACGTGLNAMGDRWGLNGLAHEGLIDTIISGHIGSAPDICDLIYENKVKAYQIPQGVVTHLYRSQANGGPGVITKVGLGTFADPRVEGCKGNSISKDEVVKLLNLDGEEWLQYKIPKINVAIIQATTADLNGNLTNEHQSAQFELLPLAMAAHNNGGIVIAQVERLAENGSLKNVDVRVPGILVDYVVVAKPENHPQTASFIYQPGLSGEMRIPVEEIPPLPLNARKIISRRASMFLEKGMIANIGIGIPEGVGSVTTEEGVGDQITITTELGSIGGAPGCGPYFGAAFNADAYLRHYEMFDFYDGGGLDIAFLGMAQVDPKGNVNVSKLGERPNGPGGFINIINSAKTIVFLGTLAIGQKAHVENGKLVVDKEGRGGKFVNKLTQITFNSEVAQKQGKKVYYVTEYAVFEVIDGVLTMIEKAKGVDLDKQVYPFMEFSTPLSKNLKDMPEGIFNEKWNELKNIMKVD